MGQHRAHSEDAAERSAPRAALAGVPRGESVGEDPAGSLELLHACQGAVRAVYEATSSDRSALRASDLVAQIEATQALVNTVMAVQLVRIAQFAATTQHSDPDSGKAREVAHELGYAAEFADVDLAPALGWGPRHATARVEEAIDAATKTPRLLDLMADGHLDPTRLRAVTDELIEAPDAVCAEVESALLDRGVHGWSAAQTRARTRRLVQQTDPAALKAARRRRVVEQTGLFTRPGREPGQCEWTAVIPTELAAPAHAAVETLARHLHTDNLTGKTLGQCRIDALTDLILQRADVTTHITVHAPVSDDQHQPGRYAGTMATSRCTASTAKGTGTQHDPDAVPDQPTAHDLADWDAALAVLVATDPGPPPLPDFDDPWWDEVHAFCAEQAELSALDQAVTSEPVHDVSAASPFADAIVPGIGVISGALVAELTRAVGTRITRALVDASTGTLLETCTSSYRPTAAIRRLLVLRDQHCRFPGCSQPGRYCEADHVTPWPLGRTSADNLQLLCKHHHRAKHEAGWAVAMTSEGTCTWTSPHTGRTYVTTPEATATRGYDHPNARHERRRLRT
ncbi:HNH endonuclease signature motif containing protein [Luteipulveratus halotolerans]|uniref:HNH nuclease domain-containing protein n=1 Tax=Luteipulveratus halotolerans TaxID=1631356 RepID=A0A0L6CJQ2_9MICO|nr:HNH endonuclease signature motif containing protein [Luteipulveratus halotolerans]KNX38021.1 hypothetical protein VV01_14075 [Luteipulveratus halotolerans]